jgi:signal peptidase I
MNVRERIPVGDIVTGLLECGKSVRIKAFGLSMYPSVVPGSDIVIEPLIIKGLPVPGEIIVFRREGHLVLHRLLSIITSNGKTYYITRGDRNAFRDAPSLIENIAGRVVNIETPRSKAEKDYCKRGRTIVIVFRRLRNIFLWILLKIKHIYK